MSTLLLVLASLLGATVTAFLFWKALYEDYSRRTIFNTFFIILASVFIAAFTYNFAISVLLPGALFWAVVAGLVIGLMIAVRKHETDAFLIFESLVPGVLFWLASVVLLEAVFAQHTLSLLFSLLTYLMIPLFLYLKRTYKRFTWYKSGKVGFASLVTMAVYFLVRALFAVAFSGVISVPARMDAPVSVAVAFILLFLMYNRD